MDKFNANSYFSGANRLEVTKENVFFYIVGKEILYVVGVLIV